ncbi:hypothetical protein [Leisingera sp. ANG-M1]|nr:hypothetical protein [Leisingera sp. ANG-M1]
MTMNLHTACNLLIRRRRDWRGAHLAWLPPSLYRSYLTRRKIRHGR